MARREINVFNLSFLDLLAGALGAVIILYIIIPKITTTAEEYEEQKKMAAVIQGLGKSLEDIKNDIPKDVYDDITRQMKELEGEKKALDQKIKNQAIALKECENEKIKLKEKIAEQQKQIKDYKEYYDWMEKCELNPDNKCPKKTPKNINAGFDYKGKRIVFIVDVSGSMSPKVNDYKEDRITQVKFGLAMLLKTMDSSFKVDIVKFPNRGLSPYQSMWNNLKPLTELNKTEATNYLRRLEPYGCTPTRPTLKFVLSNYPQLTDIVLLSDGTPTIFGNPDGTQCPSDDIDNIINEITRLNNDKVRINTIGVGKDFVYKDTIPAIKFLKGLKTTDGYYIGF